MTTTQIVIGSLITGAIIGGLNYFVTVPIADKNKVINSDTKKHLAITQGAIVAILVAAVSFYHKKA